MPRRFLPFFYNTASIPQPSCFAHGRRVLGEKVYFHYVAVPHQPPSNGSTGKTKLFKHDLTIPSRIHRVLDAVSRKMLRKPGWNFLPKPV
ncbi:MAG: hypothetical protein QXS12_07430 [Candidatus Caldarchaeum sp.]